MKKINISIVIMTMIFQMSFASVSALAAENKIKIDIISDVVCPWCAVGYKRLSTAIVELNMEDKVEIVWHPFQLNPEMPKEGQNADNYLMKKLGLSEEKLVEKRKSVTKLAKNQDLNLIILKI